MIGAIVALLAWFGWSRWSNPPPAQAGAPALVEVAARAGIDHVYDGEFTFFVGGGVAVFDCDADSMPDIYLAGGTRAATLYRNIGAVGGDLAFETVAQPSTDLTSVTGAYPLDIDGDDVLDLAVLRFGENVLLRGLGDCRFERANESWSFDGGDLWTVGFSATWETGQHLPTLAFGNYLEMDANGERTGNCSDNTLVRPAGASSYAAPVRLRPGWCTLSMLFSDWSRTGRPDLRVSNDRQYYRDGEEQLWRIADGGPPRLYTETDGWRPLQINGMGIASYDVTGDGMPEVFLTSMGDNRLQTHADAPGPVYDDIAFMAGVTAHRPFAGGDALPSTAWHAEFADVNNDGYIDLYIAKGNVDAMAEAATYDPSNLLLGTVDGTFVEGAEAAGIVRYSRTRGAALADFNLDGLLDLIEVNRREPATLWRNLGSGSVVAEPMGNWLSVALHQPDTNTSGVGAWIEIRLGDRTLSREVTVGGGHASGQDGWHHFGLGSADNAELSVIWPDGERTPWQRVDANQHLRFDRSVGSAAAAPTG
jgi:hypothetical protein